MEERVAASIERHGASADERFEELDTEARKLKSQLKEAVGRTDRFLEMYTQVRPFFLFCDVTRFAPRSSPTLQRGRRTASCRSGCARTGSTS